MRRRQGFTLVELLVAMALIIFIMAILSQAFVSATSTFRMLKASGDMAEKLRATSQVLQRDLAADHFEGKKRLSNANFWLNGPPQQGYFQVWQGSAPSIIAGSPCYIEGYDLDNIPPNPGIGSYRSVNHTLAFTIKMRGNQMGDFLSAGVLCCPAWLPSDRRRRVTRIHIPAPPPTITSGPKSPGSCSRPSVRPARPIMTAADPATGSLLRFRYSRSSGASVWPCPITAW